MKQLELLFYQAIESTVSVDGDGEDVYVADIIFAAEECAKITERIALEFHEWAETSKEAHDFFRKHPYQQPMMDGSHHAHNKKVREKLFSEFLKQKYEI